MFLFNLLITIYYLNLIKKNEKAKMTTQKSAAWIQVVELFGGFPDPKLSL